MWEWLSNSWSSAEVGWCRRKMGLNIEVNVTYNGLVQRQMWVFESESRLYPKLWHDHQTSWEYGWADQFCEEEGSKVSPESSAGLILGYPRVCLSLLLPKKVRHVITYKGSLFPPALWMFIFNKDMKDSKCVCVISWSTLWFQRAQMLFLPL